MRLGPPQNVFTATTETAAEAARDAYALANPTWRTAYQTDQRLFVLVRWGSGGNEKATVLLSDGTTWRDIDYLFVGKTGPKGIPGGGAIEDTGIVTDGTANRPADEFLATGFMLGDRGDTPYVLYRMVSDTLALLWFSTDELYDLTTASAGDTSAAATRILLPESAGSSVSGDIYAGLTDAGELLIATENNNIDITVKFFRYVPAEQRDFTIKDVTGTGPPEASSATVRYLYLDTEIPRAWLTHLEREYVDVPSGTFVTFSDSNYIGDFRTFPDATEATAVGQIWYRHGNYHAWYRVRDILPTPFSRQVTAETALGTNSTWLGDADTAQDALNRITSFDTNRRYIFFNVEDDEVQILQNNSYSAQTPVLVYSYVSIELERDVAESMSEILVDTPQLSWTYNEEAGTLTPVLNVSGLSDAQRIKLDGIEVGATADQTGSEIKTAYEGESDTNAFTDAEKTSLAELGTANWVESVTASGSTITITRRDGTVTTHTFPMGGGGGVSDGVLDEAPVFDESAQTVTFHISTGQTFTLDLANLVTQTELDAVINGLANQTDSQVKASYERNPDTNAFVDAEKTKLGTVAESANRVIPYKIGNIYRATAAGVVPAKPGNTEGTVAITGISVAPVDWQLTRPEATEALSDVFDCHVYGYEINGIFSWQFGTPNRTDRYNSITEAAVNTLIQAALAAAVTGNTEQGIVVTYNPPDGTIDFVVMGVTPSGPRESIYFGVADDISNLDTLDVTPPFSQEDATVAGHAITIGPTTTVGQYFVIFAPSEHDILSLINQGTQAEALAAYTKMDGVRTLNSESYDSYTLGPLNLGVRISYHVTLQE